VRLPKRKKGRTILVRPLSAISIAKPNYDEAAVVQARFGEPAPGLLVHVHE
jgi:hypothetical protein